MPKLIQKDIPRVVLLGRTNVGKSTLFSRITDEAALISKTPHTTRDAKDATAEWNGVTINLVDTGGFDIEQSAPFSKEVSSTIERELEKAHIIALVTDTTTLHASEEAWLRHFRKKGKEVLIIVNKQDRATTRARFPLEKIKGIPVFALSSINGGGIGDFLDQLVTPFQQKDHTEIKTGFRLGLIGRTNVGKSALFNALIGENKAIVSDEDHTTRESLKAQVPWNDRVIEIIDTAGAQKKAKQKINQMSQKLTMQTIQTCDVLALVIEAGQNPLPRQDLELARTVLEEKKSLIIILNKWDLFDDKTPQGQMIEEKRIKSIFSFADFVPAAFVSAQSGHRIPLILDLASLVYEERFISLEIDQLKDVQKTLSEHVRTVKQLHTDPPRFHSICTERSVPQAMTNILEKEIRKRHPFIGTPIILSLAKKGRRNETRNRSR